MGLIPVLPQSTTVKICAVLPTYNNGRSLESVIQAVSPHVPDIIVVNDGSRDETAAVLQRFPDVTVVTHAANQGKGAALADGLAHAAAMGFTHAISFDTDGQHPAGALPAIRAAIAAHPDAIVIGVRDLKGAGLPVAGAGRPLKSRLLRAHSNFWVWVETGRWVHDTQSGLRAYPLRAVQALVLNRRRYDYEIEVLVKAMWAGTPVAEAPGKMGISPIGAQPLDPARGPELVEGRPNGSFGQMGLIPISPSKSSFRPLRDFALVSQLNAALVAQRVFLPASLRDVLHLKTFRADFSLRRAAEVVVRGALAQCPSQRSIALCLGLGVCFGILPIWGFQMAAALVVAHHLRLSKVLVVAASNISFPAAIPFILYASLLTGRLALTGHLDHSLHYGDLNLAAVWNYTLEYVVGSIILAVAAGLVVAGISYLLIRYFARFRRGRSPCGRASVGD